MSFAWENLGWSTWNDQQDFIEGQNNNRTSKSASGPRITWVDYRRWDGDVNPPVSFPLVSEPQEGMLMFFHERSLDFNVIFTIGRCFLPEPCQVDSVWLKILKSVISSHWSEIPYHHSKSDLKARKVHTHIRNISYPVSQQVVINVFPFTKPEDLDDRLDTILNQVSSSLTLRWFWSLSPTHWTYKVQYSRYWLIGSCTVAWERFCWSDVQIRNQEIFIGG
jgi:hypothetical protein